MSKKKRLKYIIAFHSYNPNEGGSVVTYKLCDLLNALGEKAMMCPIPVGRHFPTIYAKNWCSLLSELLQHPVRHLKTFYVLVKYWLIDYTTCKAWDCPVMNPFRMLFTFPFKNWIMVYHQEVYGDYFGATNRVRWFTHNPGYFSGTVKYLPGELYFRYSNSFGREFIPPKNSFVSNSFLQITTIPECYNQENISENRTGTAYFLRKGKGKLIVHDLSNSILLDGKSHEEVAKILKTVKMLISYDSITAYSFYALLCHCPSVVILGEGETPDTYRPNEEEQQKFAYSIESSYEKDWAESFLWAEGMAQEAKDQSRESVRNFIKESQTFFNLQQ